MQRHQHEFRVTTMCRVLQVTRQGYYAWRKRSPSARCVANEHLRVLIRDAHAHSRRSYGSPRIHRQLQHQGCTVGVHRVARLMAQEGLRAKRTRRFRVTTDSRCARTVHGNVLNRDFAVGAPQRAWVSDITYLWTLEGWLYLAVVLDVGTRRVVGWSLRESLAVELVTQALDMALGRGTPPPGLICHSDRGSQYAAQALQDRLSSYQMIGSMGRKADCWDNAVAESFFASLKVERAADARWASRPEAKSDVVEWIEGWYNRERLHSALGYLSPEDYEKQFEAQTL